jgi:cytochrome c biogenesis protein CcmG/thiol:disulfide interchange protein DsbE
MTATDTAEATPRPRRTRLLLIFGAVILLGALLAVVLGGSTHTSGGTAKTFDLESVDSNGPRVALSNYRGRPLVINFWASWCIPCRSEMPGFEHIHQRVGDRIQFVGIDHQDTRPNAAALLHDTGVTYPTGFDPDGHAAFDYGLVGMPTTVFISADGKVLDQHTGQLSEQELQADLDRLFPAP